VVWDSVDCISYLFDQAVQYRHGLAARMLTHLELGRTRRHEAWLTGQFDHVLVTSLADKSALEQLAETYAGQAGIRAPISVLSNGVDLAYFRPHEAARRAGQIVFSGKMSYHANVTAALYLVNEVMPLVWTEKPESQLVIAGSRPPQSITDLAAAHQGRVIVTGYLEDLRVPLQESSAAAAPLLYGAGIQNKVLEAMACATPVVATPRAVAALTVTPGVDCLVADTPLAFAAALLRLLGDGALRARMGEDGRRYVELNHDWTQIVKELEFVYQTAKPPLDNPHASSELTPSLDSL
jgi:glycosyltransferase involved in cell wall biosynthesis